MNEKKAKELRKAVYGDSSLKTPRKYVIENGTVYVTGLRQRYQQHKKVN